MEWLKLIGASVLTVSLILGIGALLGKTPGWKW